MQNREVMYLLQTARGIGRKTIARLWNYFITGEEIMQASEKELDKLMRPSQVKQFLTARDSFNPAEELHTLKERGIEYYSVFDEKYPARLRAIKEYPYGLFVKGELPPEECMAVSIVGTRRHSYYGEKYTKEFSRIIAKKGIPIISGMARGIDGIAQRMALECGGKTFAVLGCGVDICYPKEHTELFSRIPYQGGIISEYPPGMEPAAGLFPMRNRIISALCDVLLVMEAREKSGTLITVDMALEQGKEVWVLPGRIDDVLSVGCNRLLAQGAGILPSVLEFEKELELLFDRYSKKKYYSYENPKRVSAEADVKKQGISELSETEQKIMNILDYQPFSINYIYNKLCGNNREVYSIQQLSIYLMELCMKHLVIQMEGGYYMRC